VKVFQESAAFNGILARAFRLDDGASAVYDKVYPDGARVPQLKADLLRLRIGPYRNLYSDHISHEVTPAVLDPTPLHPGGWVRQRIENVDSSLCGVRYQIVTWGRRLRGGAIAWRIADAQKPDATVTEGTISLDGRSDWDTVDLPLTQTNLAAYLVEIRVVAQADHVFGLPTRRPAVATWANPTHASSSGGAPLVTSLPFDAVTCPM